MVFDCYCSLFQCSIFRQFNLFQMIFKIDFSFQHFQDRLSSMVFNLEYRSRSIGIWPSEALFFPRIDFAYGWKELFKVLGNPYLYFTVFLQRQLNVFVPSMYSYTHSRYLLYQFAFLFVGLSVAMCCICDIPTDGVINLSFLSVCPVVRKSFYFFLNCCWLMWLY